jgi:hypothetical protein
MDNDDKRGRRMFRLIRISLILTGLFLVTVVLHPERFLPPDMTLGEFFQALLGVLMLSGVFAAAAFRAWNDYQKKKRDRQ